jgi:hypothetical protein
MSDSQDGHIDDVATASFNLKHADGKTTGHALTIKSVTADTVTLINPWHPDKEITMSREEFKRSAKKVTVASMTESPSENNGGKQNIQDIINHLIGINITQLESHTSGGQTGNLSSSSQQAIVQVASQLGISATSASQTSTNQAIHRNYTIQTGTTYTNMIKDMLNSQGIEPTQENIRKAKAQFEALNPGAVKTSERFKNKKGQMIPYVLANATVKVPKFSV